jgi:hypothetical protein
MSDSKCETLILPQEEDILSSPTPTVNNYSHIRYIIYRKMSTYECQKQRNCPEIVHMTLSEAAEMHDVINKQHTHVMTSQ